MGPSSIYKFAVCFDWSLNLSKTQCGSFINLQICSLLWLKVLSILIESLIRFDQKFWSSSTESFHQFWLKVWSNFYQSRSSPTESFDQVWLKVFDQVWLEVLIKFDWKFSSILVESFDQAFINSGWKFWSSFYQFWSSPIESFDQVWMKVLRQSVFTNFGWKFDQTFINPDQVRLKVLIKSDWRSLIRFDWKFWSSLIESFHQFWLKVLIKLLSILVESSDQAFINSDQVRLKVLIKFEWKFSSILVESSDQAFINPD